VFPLADRNTLLPPENGGDREVRLMFALLSLPWVRKCLEGALVLAAIGAIAYALYDKGVHAGQRAEASAQIQETKAEFDRIEGTFNQQLSAANATAEKYRDLVNVLLQQAQQSAAKAQAALAAGNADKEKLAALPDPEIQQDLESKLGGPLTSTTILRLDDTIVTDYPHVKAQASALASQVTSLQAAADAQDKQIEATQKERDSAIDAHNAILPLYTKAYNAAVVRHRHWWCLWICKSKPLKLPAPTTLHKI
jgi:Tfp pilus assembly protein PilE